MEPFTVTLSFEKTTKNTVRYAAEEPTDGVPPKIKTLYLPKWVAGRPAPDSITVTVEPED